MIRGIHDTDCTVAARARQQMSQGDFAVCKAAIPRIYSARACLTYRSSFVGIKHAAVCLYGTSVAKYNGNLEYHYAGNGRMSWPFSRSIVVLEMKHGAVLVYSFKQPRKYIIHIYVHSPVLRHAR